MLKILLADDEPRVLEELRGMIDWDGLGLEIAGEAADGKTALDMINSIQPDIVITDINMPEMSGLELLKICSDKKYRPEFLMLSGCGEFEYVRSSMKYGAVRFLTKPADAEEVTGALRDVSEFIYDKRENKRFQNEALDAVKQETFQRILFGETDEILYRRACFLLGISEKEPIHITVLRAMNGISDKDYESFKNDIRYLVYEDGMVSFSIGDRTAVLLDRNIDSPEGGKIAQIASGYFTGVYTADAESLSELPELYRAAIDNFAVPSEGVVPITRSDGKRLKYKGNPDEVLRLAMSGKTEEAFARIDSDIEEIQRSGGGIANASGYASAMLISMCRSANPAGINMEELFDDALNAVNNSYDCKTIQMLCRECLELFIQVAGRLDELGAVAMTGDIIEYIKEHYSEDLTLIGISKNMHLNSGIVSKSIKSGTGMKFNDYLNFVRIQNAKRLILNSNTKISQIAYDVGYNDYYYFTSKFKKLTGELPSDYRKKQKTEE
ncbi:MAG: response regulator [Candidatus Ornithomonoglobus sp.]